MEKMIRRFSLLLVIALVVGIFAGCQQTPDETEPTETKPLEVVDYVSNLKLDMNSETVKQEVTVKAYIDGDTTHFHVPREVSDNGILKARYLAVNTPESTGKIEEWGKKASSFTKEKLSAAKSIIIESDDGNWNADSTGERYLVWVWYQPAEGGEYRCLNLELIQNGLSLVGGNNSQRYGDITMQAFMQAKAQMLHVFSKEDDPDFYYGDAYEVDLKGLRTNIALYEGKKVAFEGVITQNHSNTVYVEHYDAETDMYYGISVYYGFAVGEILNILQIGNKVRVVGTVTYYEAGGTWQVSDVSYREFKPNDPGNTIMLSQDNELPFRLTDPTDFNTKKYALETLKSLDSEDVEDKEFVYADLAMSTSIRMENLKIVNISTTSNGGDNDGAMTLTCEVDGQTIKVRTIVLYGEGGKMYTAADYQGKTIDVKGIVDYFSGEYQIKVFSANDITVHE